MTRAPTDRLIFRLASVTNARRERAQMAARKKTRQRGPKKASRKSATRKTTQRKTAKGKTVKTKSKSKPKPKSKGKSAPKAGEVVYSDLRKIALARALTRH